MLAAGTQLGHYQIERLIGAGGMGEVYRGIDTRLRRPVAIKVLPPSVTRDPQRREQFEREARAIASLSHPYICAIYDVGAAIDVEFLVMELVEGETLAERLAARSLRFDEAIEHAAQIADALDAAHRRGIVHRDLKPSNVMITSTGVKLLDFGLAQWQARLPPALVITETEPAGDDGPTRGTLAYMSPEQMHGKRTDARTDVFALGLVLYEMLTGHRPFEADTRAGVIAATLEHEPPPISSRHPRVPIALERCVLRCLAKDPEQRWQSARDLAAELRWVAVQRTSNPRTGAGYSRRSGGFAIVRYIGTAALAAAATVAVMLWTTPASPATPHVFDVHVPDGIALQSPGVLSPNGEHLAYIGADRTNARRIWVRTLAAPDRLARFLPGTEDAHTLFWSPDSMEMAFFAGNRLKAIHITTNAVRPIATAEQIHRAAGSWSRHGVIVFATSDAAGGGPLYAVAATGGSIRPVTAVDAALGDDGHRFPHFLPDGTHFLYTAQSTQDDREGLFVGSLDGGRPVRVLDSLTRGVYVPPGWLLYTRATELVVRRFDLRTSQVIGDAVPLGEHLGIFGAGANVAFSVSDTGLLATVMSDEEPSRLEWRSRAGDVIDIVRGGHELRNPAISRDGSRVAAVRGRTQTMWWSGNPAADFVRVGGTDINYYMPLWSPDGRRIAYGAGGAAGSRIAIAPIDDPANEEVLVPEELTVKHPHDWSSDGWVSFARRMPDSGFDIWLVSTETHEMRPFLSTPAHEFHGRVAPAGTWMAFASNPTGRFEIYAERFPRGGDRIPISTEGGTDPQWRGDGRELFYLSRDKWLTAVPVASIDPLRFGTPVPLFRFATVGVGRNHYSPSPDGQRFLVDAALPQDGHPTVTILIDWLPDRRARR